MTSNPRIESDYETPAVRQLVSEGKPINPAMQALIDEKNRRANATSDVQQPVKPAFESHGAANLRRVERMAHHAVEAGKRYPGKNTHDAMCAQALAIVEGGEFRLPIPEGVNADLFQRRILNTLSKRGDTGKWLWSMKRTVGEREYTVSCRGIDRNPAPTIQKHGKRPKSPKAVPPIQQAVLPQPEPGVATDRQSGPRVPTETDIQNAAVDDYSDGADRRHETAGHSTNEFMELRDKPAFKPASSAPCPVLEQEVHEFGLDLTHSLCAPALEPFDTQPAVHEAVHGQPEPAASPDTSVARAVGAIGCIADAIPPCPLESELVEAVMAYWHGGPETDDLFMGQEGLCDRVRGYRRAKAIVESVLAPWLKEWDFTGAEEPVADLARRLHAAIVELMAIKEKGPAD